MASPFLVVGAMKSGTTTLHELLARHPDVDLVAEKERSALADPAFSREFAARLVASRAAVAGEVTAGYMQLPLMPQPVSEAADLLGSDLRVVAILREPVARAVSHWEHLTQLGREARPADVAILDPDSSYLAFSRYHHQLAAWADLVGDDRVLPLRLEDFRADPASTADRLFGFLGVPSLPHDQVDVHANAGTTRVVASGWRSRVSRSSVYRTVARPLLSSRTRRRALRLVGGGSRRVHGALSGEERAAVDEFLAGDLALLAQRWPEARWS